MKNFDEAGAEAAAQYMIDVLNYTYNTGDFTYLDAVAVEDCDLCGEIRSHVKEIRNKGGIVTGSTMMVQNIEFHGQINASWVLNAKLNYPDSAVVNENNQILGNLSGRGEVERQVVLVNNSDKEWKFASLGEVAFK